MKKISTESFSVERYAADDLDALLTRAEEALIRNKKQPLRVVVMELSSESATILASVLYEV